MRTITSPPLHSFLPLDFGPHRGHCNCRTNETRYHKQFYGGKAAITTVPAIYHLLSIYIELGGIHSSWLACKLPKASIGKRVELLPNSVSHFYLLAKYRLDFLGLSVRII